MSNWDSPAWTWTDYGQSRRIRELREELDATAYAQHEANSRLRSQLSHVTGSLEQRINRLSAAFDAFVEISDLRQQLAVFDGPALVRLRAKQVIMDVPGEPDIPATPGYWLAPALGALNAARSGADPTSLLAEAAGCDAHRAALFHVLTSAQFGRGDAVCAEQVGEALGSIDTQITLAQRAVWTLAADGHFGPKGRDAVLHKLTEHIDGLPDAARQSQVKAWCAAVKPETARTLPTQQGGTSVAGILDAGDRLGVLRGWLADMLADRPASQLEPDESVRRTLELLVEEGSPAERELLARERELRQVIEDGKAQIRTWQDPAGETLTLLRTDIEDTDRPDRAALAVRASAPLVLAAARQLAEQAKAPAPAEISAGTPRGWVVVTRAGVDQSSVDIRVGRLTEDNLDGVSFRRNAIIAASAAAGCVPLGLAIGWFLFVMAGICAVAAGFFWLGDRKARREAAEQTAATRRIVLAKAEEQVKLFSSACTAIDKQRPGVDVELAAIEAQLA